MRLRNFVEIENFLFFETAHLKAGYILDTALLSDAISVEMGWVNEPILVTIVARLTPIEHFKPPLPIFLDLSRSWCRNKEQKIMNFILCEASFVKSCRQVIDYAIDSDFGHGLHKKVFRKGHEIFLD